jgi:hypothetical protein
MSVNPRALSPIELGCAEPDDMVVVGMVVIVVGSLEAVSLKDGHFTAALQRERFADRIHLSFSDSLRDQVRDNICCRVAVEGCLRASSLVVTGRPALELHSIRRID